MPRIKIIVVGQTKIPFLLEGQQFYLDRLRHYATVGWTEVRSIPMRKKSREKSIKDQEGISLLKHINDRDYVIALDQRGKMYDSREMASRMEKLFMEQGRPAVIIGGALGLSEDVLKRAQAILSLSRFTFTHEMARLFFLEQLYRAFTIVRGEKYHK